MSKTKKQTTKRVEWVVQWTNSMGIWLSDAPAESEADARELAEREAVIYGTPHRVVRRVIEETVVAEVKP